MSTPNTDVTHLHRDRESIALATLTLAFIEDPANRWCWRNPDSYLASFPAFVRALGGRAFAHQSAFEIANTAGAALWLPPGIEPNELALMSVIETTVPLSVRAELNSIIEQMGRCHPAEPHWYLPFVGIDPLHQGRGLGALLLRRVLQRCDAEQVPAYLESTNVRNVPFYERLGFRAVGRIQAGTSPVIVPMLREPNQVG